MNGGKWSVLETGDEVKSGTLIIHHYTQSRGLWNDGRKSAAIVTWIECDL